MKYIKLFESYKNKLDILPIDVRRAFLHTISTDKKYNDDCNELYNEIQSGNTNCSPIGGIDITISDISKYEKDLNSKYVITFDGHFTRWYYLYDDVKKEFTGEIFFDSGYRSSTGNDTVTDIIYKWSYDKFDRDSDNFKPYIYKFTFVDWMSLNSNTEKALININK